MTGTHNEHGDAWHDAVERNQSNQEKGRQDERGRQAQLKSSPWWRRLWTLRLALVALVEHVGAVLIEVAIDDAAASEEAADDAAAAEEAAAEEAADEAAAEEEAASAEDDEAGGGAT